MKSKRGNIENLRTPTSEEAREIGRKGGIKSGQIRKEKKTFLEKWEIIRNHKEREYIKSLRDAGASEQAIQLEECGLEAFKMMEILNDANLDNPTKLRVLQEILNRTEGMPTQKQELKTELLITPVIQDDV